MEALNAAFQISGKTKEATELCSVRVLASLVGLNPWL